MRRVSKIVALTALCVIALNNGANASGDPIGSLRDRKVSWPAGAGGACDPQLQLSAAERQPGAPPWQQEMQDEGKKRVEEILDVVRSGGHCVVIITGGMKSGKSGALFDAANRFEANGYQVLRLLPALVGGHREARDGMSFTADFDIDPDGSLGAFKTRVTEWLKAPLVPGHKRLIACDEWQFVRRELRNVIYELGRRYGIPILLAAVDLDCYGESWFSALDESIPYGLRRMQSRGFCEAETGRQCGKRATFTVRTADGKIDIGGRPVVKVDGADPATAYFAACSEHYSAAMAGEPIRFVARTGQIQKPQSSQPPPPADQGTPSEEEDIPDDL